jgi:superfamily I DNA/RNA helicase
MTSFTPSSYQQSIFNWVENSSGSAIINAVAGSGKTTTILQGLSLIPQHARTSCAFLAFNHSIAQELATRVPPGVQASTFHSLAFRSLPRGCKVRAGKTRQLARSLISATNFARHSDFLVRIVSLAKSAALSTEHAPLTRSALQTLVEHHDLDVSVNSNEDSEPIDLLATATSLLALSVNDFEKNRVIDFDDMLYLPIFLDLPLPKFSWLFIDEAQDTNLVQRLLLHKMTRSDSRLVAVGDPFQAIYGFRGASVDSLELIRSEFHATELPLSISYRCSRKVVEYAKTLVPNIEPSPNAPEGSVENLDALDIASIPSSSAIICRNTAPIVRAAFRLLRAGRGCTILGRDIASSLTKFVTDLKANNLDELEARLDSFLARERERLLARGREASLSLVEDKIESIRAIIDGLDEGSLSVAGLLNRIATLFSADPQRGLITLSTIHKSKGLEWPTVYILDPWRIPSRWATQDWQLAQEQNLLYVAVTRAKRDLRFINLEGVA